MNNVVFFDFEVSENSQKIKDIGAKNSNRSLHSGSIHSFIEFIRDADFLCGHNIIQHDYKYIAPFVESTGLSPVLIDTLYLSPLLFPEELHHSLEKDDKILSEQLNNPYNDALKAERKFDAEISAYKDLPIALRQIYCSLLYNCPEFSGFFRFLKEKPIDNISEVIKEEFCESICTNAEIDRFIDEFPIELAYSLALIHTQDRQSILPPWISFNFPKVEYIITQLRDKQCTLGCEYCNKHFDIYAKLKQLFGYDSFRTYDGEALQEQAVQAAVDGKPLLAIFPTGGGKSLTFQLPALMAAENTHGLTVVISPLVSLMKDQVDNLIEKKNIYGAVTINGLLNSLERKKAIESVIDGSASILYIAPELLRSNTVERILRDRHITRFVIDEAHCFSAWGQDFRVDYLYIGKFIRKLQETKQLKDPIPVSCFTATAKPKVISDIYDYFRKELGIELELYTSKSTRKNLRYKVIHVDSDKQRYEELKRQIEAKNCPTIVYVSKTKEAEALASRLNENKFSALPFHGKMDKEQKIENQNEFMQDKCQIMVATSAFGMGVDKDNVGLVIHYEISSSLENYLQEAGRAGRDPKNNADCVVLFNDDDLNEHFKLLNQTKLSMSEIQQVWKAIKELTKTRQSFTKSPLEIAKMAGWSDERNSDDIETNIKAAIAELERVGFIERENNVPRVYATSIRPSNMTNAVDTIDHSTILNETEKKHSKQIIHNLISKKYRAKAGNDDAEYRVDYLADILGIETSDVISCINKLREINILDDDQDMHAYLKYSKLSTAKSKLNKLFDIETFLINNIDSKPNYKELNNKAIQEGIEQSTINDIKNILFFWYTKKYIVKEYDDEQERNVYKLKVSKDDFKAQLQFRMDIIQFILDLLYQKATDTNQSVNFSLLEILSAYNSRNNLFVSKATVEDIESSLLYLSKVNALEIDGNFLVFYNSLQIKRLQLDNRQRYTEKNYKILQEFYSRKIQQIHIVGEYANLMMRNVEQALKYVLDYFSMDYMKFIDQYFKDNRAKEIQRNITAGKYKELFDNLSPIQREIIDDHEHQYIVVAAGPGSGKTMVLVHKLASLLLLEDVKSEQLLMLTFSRAAAIEFKKRLIDLIGSAAYYVEIKTFHSYCFDLMGQIGSVEKFDTVVKDTAKMIEDGEVEVSKITKTVLVIDEAQDMNKEQFELVRSLMHINPDMRVIAVGDDDQNIYAFRESKSIYMKSLITEFNAKSYEMIDNYRSDKLIVDIANKFSKFIPNRMKNSDIKSLSNDDGTVILTKTCPTHVDEVGLKIFYNTYDKDKHQSCAILTCKNETAYNIHQDLIDHGYKAKVILEDNNFALDNLYELRWFFQKLESKCPEKTISQKNWDTCYEDFLNHFKNSRFINECQALLTDFDKLNKYKYISDFKIFLKESYFRDFITPEKGTILVSTIHKAKGKEFDNVYLVLEDYHGVDKERAVYVGITRAKHFLSITYNNKIFDNPNIEGIQYNVDDNRYEEMNKIVMPLSLQDVVLKYYQNSRVQGLLSKSNYNYNIESIENGLTFGNNTQGWGKLYYSKARIQKLNGFLQKGYTINKAEFYCFVYWTDYDAEEEYLIALPILYLSKD